MVETEHAQSKKVHFDDWMVSEDEKDDSSGIATKRKAKDVDYDKVFADDKFSKREKKGHLLLQLQKTYKGDDRFMLNKDFTADDTKQLP